MAQVVDNSRIVAHVQAAQTRPSNAPDLERWLTGEDALAFLDGTKTETGQLYVSARGPFVHGVFISNDRLQGDYWTDLLGWNFGVASGWGYGFRRREPDEPTTRLGGRQEYSVACVGLCLARRYLEQRRSFLNPTQIRPMLKINKVTDNNGRLLIQDPPIAAFCSRTPLPVDFGWYCACMLADSSWMLAATS